MNPSSNQWPLVLALVSLIGFAVVRHSADRPPSVPRRPATEEQRCFTPEGKRCSSGQRLLNIRGLRIPERAG
jgi:hypothetical protein